MPDSGITNASIDVNDPMELLDSTLPRTSTIARTVTRTHGRKQADVRAGQGNVSGPRQPTTLTSKNPTWASLHHTHAASLTTAGRLPSEIRPTTSNLTGEHKRRDKHAATHRRLVLELAQKGHRNDHTNGSNHFAPHGLRNVQQPSRLALNDHSTSNCHG